MKTNSIVTGIVLTLLLSANASGQKIALTGGNETVVKVENFHAALGDDGGEMYSYMNTSGRRFVTYDKGGKVVSVGKFIPDEIFMIPRERGSLTIICTAAGDCNVTHQEGRPFPRLVSKEVTAQMLSAAAILLEAEAADRKPTEAERAQILAAISAVGTAKLLPIPTDKKSAPPAKKKGRG